MLPVVVQTIVRGFLSWRNFACFCDTVGNSLSVVWQFLRVLVCIGPRPLFLLCFCCCFSWRNANLAGGFAGRLPLRLFVFVLVFYLELPTQFINGTTVFHAEFIIRLTCLYQFQDQALERHRPSQRKKNLSEIVSKGFELWFLHVAV